MIARLLALFSLTTIPVLVASAQGNEGGVPLPSERERPATERILRAAQERNEALPAWKNFRAESGQWSAVWNERQNTPSRVWGDGYQIEGIRAVTGENVEASGRAFISKWAGLLRCDSVTLELVDAHRARGTWIVQFRQLYRGLPVEFSEVTLRMSDGGRVFLFGSDVYPDISVDIRPALSLEQAREAAAAGLLLPAGAVGTISGGERSIFPVAAGSGSTYHLAYHFVVPEDEFHVWQTWVDASTGQVLWRWNQVIDGITGHVTASVKTSSVLDPPSTENIFAQYMSVSNVNALTDTAGMYSSAQSGTVIARLRGPYVRISRQDAADAQVQASVANNGTFNLHWSDLNSHTTERTTFFTVMRAYRYIRAIDTSLHALDYQMLCKVNVNQLCNANFDGNGLNFFKAGTTSQGTCPATGDMPDVVMHEYGHAINSKTYIQFGKSSGMTNGALQEGLADANAAFILDRPEIGVGFFGPNTLLRTVNNTNKYPDDMVYQSHTDGLIIGGACWDMRQAVGQPLAGELVQFARHAKPDDTNTGKAFTKFFLEVLVADDNDANLANGTPHAAQIVPAFAKHGIPQGMLSIAHTKISDAPASAPIAISASVTSQLTQITTQHVRVWYRAIGGTWSSAPLAITGGNRGGTSTWSGSIPAQLAGTILQYYLEAEEAWGAAVTLPAGGSNSPFLVLIGFTSRELHTFESSQGWVGGDTGDNATTGEWIAANPVGTTVNGIPVQPEDDHSLSDARCWVTGNGSIGGDAGQNDVDGGLTTLRSPSFQTAGLHVPVIRYWRWFSNDLGAAPRDDNWVVEISSDNGSTWQTVEDTNTPANSWTEIVVPLSQYITPTNAVKLRFLARDDEPGSLVEAAVDDVELLSVDQVPVELQTVSAVRHDTRITVDWTTATERDNLGFHVEYRLSGRDDWNAAGFVDGNGTTNAQHSYQYSFMELSGRDVFVRLRQVDVSGSESYSPVVLVSAGALHFALEQNYPNPFNPSTTVTFELDGEAPVALEVRNLLGVTVLRRDLGTLSAGRHSEAVDLSAHPSGMYTCRLEAGDQVRTRAMMLSK